MNKVRSQPSVFFRINTEHTKRRWIEKWIKDAKQLNKKSIYNLTWKDFYKELHKFGIKAFLKQYGYSYKKQLQFDIAKSNLSQKRITLYDFEKRTEHALFILLRSSFFDKITPQVGFNAKNHPLSTIHYYIYHHSLNFAAISLGFANKQCFLNFFAQTLYMPEYAENMAQNLRVSIESLVKIDPCTLRKELADLYDKPLVKNKNFQKYNYTLEELKQVLEKENIAIVVASLSGCNSYAVNKKLQILRPLVNVSLQDLKQRSWEELKVNTPAFIWKIKLYQLFSRQIPLEDWITALYSKLLSSCISFPCQFFSSQQHALAYTEEGESLLNPHKPQPLPPSFYAV